MKKLILPFLASALILPALAGAATAKTSVDRARLQKAADSACHVAECVASQIQRRDLGGGIAEYTFVLHLGT